MRVRGGLVVRVKGLVMRERELFDRVRGRYV